MELLSDRQFGFPEETLRAATVAMCQGLLVAIVCLLAGFRVHDLTMLALGFMALIACLFSALQNIQGFRMIVNFRSGPRSARSRRVGRSTNKPYIISPTRNPPSWIPSFIR